MKDMMIKLAGRGYGWYLALKIGKAVLALPLFVIWLPAYLALGAVVWVCMSAWEAGRAVFDIGMEGVRFWRKNWFKGFSRKYYNSLHHLHETRPYKKATP